MGYVMENGRLIKDSAFSSINREAIQYLTDNVSESARNIFMDILPYVEDYTNRVYLHIDELAALIGKSKEDLHRNLNELNQHGIVVLYDSPYVGTGLYVNPFCAISNNSWKQIIDFPKYS